jgi:hypothetical protein
MSTERRTETHTLHFDLTHCLPDEQFTLRALGRHYPLTRHTADTLRGHMTTNKALALMAAARLRSITHFVNAVELPTDAVGLHWVSYPAKDPHRRLPEIAAVFRHVPSQAVYRAIRKRRRSRQGALPPGLSRFGITAIPDADFEDAVFGNQLLKSPEDAAAAIIFSHPDVASLNAYVAESVLHEHIAAALERHGDLVSYIKQNPTSWYTEVTVKNPANAQPLSGLTDKNGNPVKWQTQDGVNVSPQYDLSTAITGSGSRAGYAAPVIQRVLQSINNDPGLNGQKWSTQLGVTARKQTQVPPAPAPAAARRLTARLADQPTYKWATSLQTPQYGLDQDADSFQFSDGTVTFSVKNWANRGLGVYVQFFDDGDNAIANPSNWTEQISSDLKGMFEPSSSKKYIRLLGSGNIVFGIPVWTDYTSISFPFPPEAVRAQVLLGGMGIGEYDSDVDLAGIIYTSVISYGMPALLSVLSVGLQSTKWYVAFFDDPKNIRILLAVGAPLFAEYVGTATLFLDPASVLMAAANFVASVVFSSAMSAFAQDVTGYVTTQQILDNAPFVGWALKAASIAASVGAMIATTIEVCESPATYAIDIKRAMDVSVAVSPDPTHGTSTQAPIWPDVSDHFECTLLYKDGTCYQQTGLMPQQHDQPISLEWDTVPSAPSDSVQVTFNVYSSSGWLAGKWTSAWVAAVPTDGTTLTLQGSIIENLVPLTASTQYSHYQKLVFNQTSQKHEWQSGTAPGATLSARDCSDAGNNLCQLVSITLNDHAYAAGYTWKASGQGLPLDAGSTPVNAQMFAFQSISVLADPESGMKTPSRGFSQQPYLAYDQFGPQPLFSVSSAYQPQLDLQTIPDDLRTAFDGQSVNYALPANATIQVKTQGSEWIISDSTGNALYDLSLVTGDGQASVISAYSVNGNAFLFSLPSSYQQTLDGGVISDALSAAIAAASVSYAIPAGAVVTVQVQTAEWTIGLPNQTPVFDLKRSVDTIQVFKYPAPEFSKRNFYLDPRQTSSGNYYLRQVDLAGGGAASAFDYSTQQSWGSFTPADFSGMVVHPNGYVVAVDGINHKMQILKLPAAAGGDDQAPTALPMSGQGQREGLLFGPVAMTVTPDGRILVLEQDNVRVQAFDTIGNPVQCFAGTLKFTLDASFAPELDGNNVSTAFLQAYQQNVVPQLAASLTLDSGTASDLDAGNLTADIINDFGNAGIPLSSSAQVSPTAPGSLWLLSDATNGVTFDIRKDADAGDLAVYRGASLSIAPHAPGSEWLVRDKTNSLTFDVKKDPENPVLNAQQLIATMALRDPASAGVQYLDIAVESKSYIYVLSYVNDGSQLSDYRLDIYNPDGSVLSRTPQDGGTGVNGARIVVDQWRNLYTLNYERLSGPGGRTEPSVSTWIPSTPGGSSN